MSAGEVFIKRWQFVHSMTRAFAESVPDEHWTYSPHRRFAPYDKQLRHVVCVRGTYAQGIRDGAPDFARKHTHYDGPLDRSSLLAALDAGHEGLLAAVGEAGAREASVTFAGREMSLDEFCGVIVHHEGLHQGQWSIYAALAGFETPLLWRLSFGL